MKCNNESPDILQRMKGCYFHGLTKDTLFTTTATTTRNFYSETAARAFIEPDYFQKEERWRSRKNKYLAHTDLKVKIDFYHIMS